MIHVYDAVAVLVFVNLVWWLVWKRNKRTLGRIITDLDAQVRIISGKLKLAYKMIPVEKVKKDKKEKKDKK
jgi:hypothetical protein